MNQGATGTAIVLFSDIVESTRLRAELGDDAADELFDAHEVLLRREVVACHGTVVKDMGDGFMATFAAASDAVRAAVALCRTTARGKGTPEGLQLRVGLSAGDVAYRSGDCHGIPVVEAARLCAVAQPGAVLASDVVRVLAGTRGRHRFKARGALTLKGLAEPLETVEVLWHDPDAATRTPSPSDTTTGSARPHAQEPWQERYRLVQHVSEGGEGEVWRARDLRYARDVALKIRRDGGVEEIRTLLSVRPHPNLPVARDGFTREDGRQVVVMDWIDGDDLGAVLAATGAPGLRPGLVLDSISAVAEALDHLHGHEPPVVHGDVKPANIVRTSRGSVVLVDFGSSAHSGALVSEGTKGYVAPEVETGSPRSTRSDVYSLAAATVSLLTGAPPNGSPRVWTGLTSREGAAVEGVVSTGLSPDPAARPPSAGEFAIRLRAAFDGALPEGEVAFLSVSCDVRDIAWEDRPDEAAAALARFTKSAESLAATGGGHKVAAPGYERSALFVFGQPARAAAAAVAISELVTELDEPGIGLHVSAGLHVGRASTREGYVTGPAVARVRALGAAASPGETSVSAEAAAALAHDGVPIPSDGSFRVRRKDASPPDGRLVAVAREADTGSVRRRRRLTLTALAGLVVTVAVAAFWGVHSSQRLDEASLARNAAGLAADAMHERDNSPTVAALTAVEVAGLHSQIGDEGLRASVAEEVRSVLLATVVTPSRQDIPAHEGRRVVSLAASQPQLPFGTIPGRHELLATLDDSGDLQVRDLEYGAVESSRVTSVDLTPAPDMGADSLSIAPDARFLAARTAGGVELVVLGSDGSASKVGVLAGAVAPPRFGPTTTDLAVDRAGNLWDLGCAQTTTGCGGLTPVWTAPDPGIRWADIRWDPPGGYPAVVWADSLVGTTVTRREWGMSQGAGGWTGTLVRESSVSDPRCAELECRLSSGDDAILLDVRSEPHAHVLSILSDTDQGLVRRAVDAQVPYAPIGLFSTQQGWVPSRGEQKSDLLVLMAGADGFLYTQSADTNLGIGPVETRSRFRSGGTTGLVDPTGTFVIGGGADGVLRLSALAPGQPFVNAGVPDENPAMPLEGSDLVLRPRGPVGTDCCELVAAVAGTEETLPLGHARPATVRTVTCASTRVLAVPGKDAVRVLRFPDTATAVIPAPGSDGGGGSSPVSLACARGDGSVLVAVAGVGLRRIHFGDGGPSEAEVVDLDGCCANAASSVTLGTDGRLLVVSQSRGQEAEGQAQETELWDVDRRTRPEHPSPAELTHPGATLVAALPDATGFVLAAGNSVSLLTADGADVLSRHLIDVEAPVTSISVDPGGGEVVLATAATIEVVSLTSGRLLGEALGFPGAVRHDAAGALWIHPAAMRNSFVYAMSDLDSEELVRRACSAASTDPDVRASTTASGKGVADLCPLPGTT